MYFVQINERLNILNKRNQSVKILVGKNCWSVRILVGKKKSWQKILVGKNFSHFPKIWSLFTDLFFTAKVIKEQDETSKFWYQNLGDTQKVHI